MILRTCDISHGHKDSGWNIPKNKAYIDWKAFSGCMFRNIQSYTGLILTLTPSR